MVELGTFFAGVITGVVVGALIFTSTGREATKGVVGATGRRVTKYIEPR